MIQEAAKGIGVLAVSGTTLVVTSNGTTLVKEWMQIILIACTIIFTIFQIIRLNTQRKQTKYLRDMLTQARHKCDNAKEGLCPVNDIYEKLLAKKD